uniref:Fibronectin type-III domain-containing protein n=1 Tax=Mesocestoides corti TaxID=53468 RepID=A0A5K3G1S4_MESCO
GVTATTISNSAIKATVIPLSDTPNFDKYRISVKDTNPTRFCEADAKTGPWECTVSGLSGGINYTLMACSWITAGQVCSDSVESFNWTKPNGKFALPPNSTSLLSNLPFLN